MQPLRGRIEDVTDQDRRRRGHLFDEVPHLYDRVRPSHPDELFEDLVAITGAGDRSLVLERFLDQRLQRRIRSGVSFAQSVSSSVGVSLRARGPSPASETAGTPSSRFDAIAPTPDAWRP